MVLSMKKLPKAIEQFIGEQPGAPVEDVCSIGPEDRSSPYGSWWYRGVAAMMLSGRIRPKNDGSPNMTDGNRLCREANFNQYLFERIADFLVVANVVSINRHRQYQPGTHHEGFWKHDTRVLTEIVGEALLSYVQKFTGYLPWRPTTINHSHLVEFLKVFYSCFGHVAIPEESIGEVFRALALLPREQLTGISKRCGIDPEIARTASWHFWLDEKGQQALLSALYAVEWAWCTEHQGENWVILGPVGTGTLGLSRMPPVPPLSTDLTVQSNLSVLAGAGLPFEELVPLFRYCTIRRVDQMFELQLDRRRIAEAPARDSPGEVLQRILARNEPLPSTVADVLQTRSRLEGSIAIRHCRALIRPESMELLTTIREHPKLKGYVESGGPPGYLLLKPTSSLENFLRRCRDLGIAVDAL